MLFAGWEDPCKLKDTPEPEGTLVVLLPTNKTLLWLPFEWLLLFKLSHLRLAFSAAPALPLLIPAIDELGEPRDSSDLKKKD